MLKLCKQIQQQLIDTGISLLQQDAKILAHIESCEACTEFLQSVTRLDAELDQLPEYNASDELVEKTLQAIINNKKIHRQQKTKYPSRIKWASGFASVAIALATFGLLKDVTLFESVLMRADEPIEVGAYEDDTFSFYSQDTPNLPEPEEERVVYGDSTEYPASKQEGQVSGAISSEDSKPLYSNNGKSTSQTELGNERTNVILRPHSEVAKSPLTPKVMREATQTVTPTPHKKEIKTDGLVLQESDNSALVSQLKANQARQVHNQTKDLSLSLYRQGQRSGRPEDYRKQKFAELSDEGRLAGEKNGYMRDKNRNLDALNEDYDRQLFGVGGAGTSIYPGEFEKQNRSSERKSNSINVAAHLSNQHIATQFLSQLETVEGLSFQEASGYWANTYIPGDPLIRLLETKLQNWDRAGLQLEKVAYQNWQPYDAPQRSALTAYVHADKRSIQGPTRMRIQVGLKATQRKSGQRPPMNIGVVIDLRDASTAAEFSAHIDALLQTLNATKQSIDRFSLIVAGPNGGTLIPSGQFRHGSLKVALSQVLDETSKRTHVTGLTDALNLATEEVSKTDLSTLSERLLLLVTPGLNHGEFASVKTAAHQNAVAGIPMSVVGLGNKLDLTALDELILIAQGRRRILTNTSDAGRVIEQELLAASQVVARIVRLSIKLAPGVKLIDVPGSKRLDLIQTEQTREVEQSTDQRISQYLGIQSDRGEDEEGIQIVIPFMESGAAHTVLLDVLAEKPGEIADVRVRYKDLISLNNGVARAKLNIREGNQLPGPIQQNVTKNLLALQLADSIRLASQKLAEGDKNSARLLLNQQRDLLNGMRQVVTDWQTDPELLADENMLNEYLAILDSPVMDQPEQVTNISDSLAIGAHRKMLLTK